MIKVLIIDDDKLARKGLISIVPWEELGMEVVGESSNGAKALEFLAEHPVDLAVVDLAMPVMTGLEFIENSRKRWPKLQYVVLSFHEDFENVQSALRLRTLDYISKIRLDKDDCAEVFRRVAQLMEMSDRWEEATKNQDQEQWRAVEKQWLDLRWLYDEEQGNSVAKRTEALGPPLREMEYLLVRLGEAVKEEYQLEDIPIIPPVRSTSHSLEWLRGLREFLFANASAMKNTQCLSGCILQAASHIRANPADTHSINTSAQRVNLSRSYFAANFKKITGMTFNHYVRQERIRVARQMLSDGIVSPDEVAERAGYRDESYFNQVFTQITGLSPAEYRAARKEPNG